MRCRVTRPLPGLASGTYCYGCCGNKPVRFACRCRRAYIGIATRAWPGGTFAIANRQSWRAMLCARRGSERRGVHWRAAATTLPTWRTMRLMRASPVVVATSDAPRRFVVLMLIPPGHSASFSGIKSRSMSTRQPAFARGSRLVPVIRTDGGNGKDPPRVRRPFAVLLLDLCRVVQIAWVVTSSTARLPRQGPDQWREPFDFQGFLQSRLPGRPRFVD